MKSTGEQDVVKCFSKTVSLVQWKIFHLDRYVVIEILTVHAVIDNNRGRAVFHIPVVLV